MRDGEEPIADSQKPIAGDQVERAIGIAESKLGAPYVWATAGPDTFDCSGFTWWVACQVFGPQDYELRSSHHQFNVWGDPRAGRPRRGDVVFFNTTGAVVFGNLASHVGLMIAEDQFIHAANEQLGVRIDQLRGGWYDGKLIGSGRIFAGDPYPTTRPVFQEGTLRFPAGPIGTAAPWNGRPIGADWSLIARWGPTITRVGQDLGLDPRLIAVVMAVETQGVHERDGRVLEVWDHAPQDGPSVGLMQVKPHVWQGLEPGANAYEPTGNIRLGAAVLSHFIEKYGSFEAAIAEGYHPGVSPNGTTPTRYVEAARGLLRELDDAA